MGNDNKLSMPSGKRRLHSVGGRHYDDRQRNAPDVSELVDNIRSLQTSHGNFRSALDILS